MPTVVTETAPTLTQPSSVRERLLTVGDVAEWLAVSERWVRDHSTGGKRPAIKCIHMGGCIRFREKDVEEFILQWCSQPS